ncbi:Neurobeachin-like protein 2 [Bienertia sinuspersici]
MRSCFLTLRHDNNCIVEPYSPHRFSRQFGFYQDVAGELKPPLEKIPNVRFETQSSFVIPTRGLKRSLRVTHSYTIWWS